MPSVIAFLPWIWLDSQLNVGPVRLIPYERGRQPGGRGSAQQADVDGVLKAYATRKSHIVRRATLMELGAWRLGEEADADVRSDLFRAREFVAFAALAKRRLFRGHLDYCNFDNYAFVLQSYQAGHTGAFSFSTRRRDGGTNYLWDTKEFTFLKPLHVAADTKLTIDQSLLEALLTADAADRAPYEAVVEFNRANTDSLDIPIHTELVMVKSAFEFLLGVRQQVDDFVNALLPLVPERQPDDQFHGPLAERWNRERENRPVRLLEAWAREFCIRRNEGAHGRRRRGREHFVWSEESHLAFVSILFPLLVKQLLAQSGLLQMSENDQIELAWIETYLMYDPFERDEHAPREFREHPWSRIYSEGVAREELRRGLEREMERLDWNNLPDGERDT
jgi:hypothetical protein